MSATMARQGGRVQLEQSDMHLASNVAEMPNGGYLRAAPEKMQYVTKKPCADVREEKKWGVKCPWPRIVKVAIERHLQCFVKTKWTDAFLPTMAPQRIHRPTGGAEDRVHFHPTDTDSRHQNRRHHRLARHLRHPVTMRELYVPKSMIYHLVMCIHIHLFPVLSFSILMHMPRIDSTIQISIQICWLIKEYPLVSTLSAVW